MPDVEKRLRYFNGQFLQEQDFIDEQTYHIDRQRRHNRQLHTPGIAEGLTVTADEGAAEVEVAPGTALDSEGRQIVLASSRTVDMDPSVHANQTVLLVVSYHEEASDTAPVGGEGKTRWHEQPRVEIVRDDDSAPPTDTHIRLARLVISSGGTVGEHHTDVRVNAGVRLGGELELRRLTLSRSGVDPSQWPTLSSGAAGRADVDGDLNVAGTLTGNLGPNMVGPAALVDNTVSIRKLNTGLVTRSTITVRVGQNEMIPVTAPVPMDEVPSIAHFLIRAYSPTGKAQFFWNQGSITIASQDGPQTQQVVFFHNAGTVTIEVEYEIHEVLER